MGLTGGYYSTFIPLTFFYCSLFICSCVSLHFCLPPLRCFSLPFFLPSSCFSVIITLDLSPSFSTEPQSNFVVKLHILLLPDSSPPLLHSIQLLTYSPFSCCTLTLIHIYLLLLSCPLFTVCFAASFLPAFLFWKFLSSSSSFCLV